MLILLKQLEICHRWQVSMWYNIMTDLSNSTIGMKYLRSQYVFKTSQENTLNQMIPYANVNS